MGVAKGQAIARTAETPTLLLNAPLTGQRLGYPDLNGLDLLELWAFVHPARFLVPTPKGLAEALDLPQPGQEGDIPTLLQMAARALLGGGGLHEYDASNASALLGYWVRTSRTGHGYATEIGQHLVAADLRVLVQALADFGGDGKIAQINHTLTQAAGTIRGLHFQQAPHDEAKFVSCLSGAVFDVAVDLRPDSPTYLQWHGEVLSADNGRSMMIPGGFAHGFQTLTEDCELIYLHDKPYAPEAEGGLNPLDPRLAIDWPLPVSQMSPRDKALPLMPNRIAAARR